MIISELMERAISQPLSLLGEKMFYVINITEDEVRLQGEFSKELLGIIPARMQNAGQVSINGSGLITMRAKTTTPRIDVPSECYTLEVVLSVRGK